MSEKYFTVGDIRRIIAESSNEFKPKMGDGVEGNNKKNNDKSYKETEERTKKLNKGAVSKKETSKELPAKEDGNRTTLDYNPRIEPDERYKKRVEAQALGYTSELEMKNGLEKAADFEGNKRIYKQFTDASKKMNDAKTDLRHSGLAARTFDKEVFKSKTLHENVKLKPKKLTFKHTKFLNESQVLVRIPEQYIQEGQVIHMVDKLDNEYVVECVRSEKSGMIETNIISHKNNRVMNEQMNRINQLMGFESDTNGKFNKQNAINEETEFKNILDITRKNNK